MVDVSVQFVALCAAATLTAAGLALAWIGWRGRGRGDHPVCRNCGFNLTGLLPDCKRCPECGTELAGPGAIRVGVRVRRRAPLLSGVILLLLAGGAGTLLLLPTARRIDWDRYTPASWLARAADAAGDNVRRDAARRELLRRLGAKQLSAESATDLAERALRRQADMSVPWDAWWGDFVEQARSAGLITDELWTRYVGGALTGYTLDVSPTASRRSGLKLNLETRACRAGSESRVKALSRVELTVSGIPVNVYRNSGYDIVYHIEWVGAFDGAVSTGWTEDLNDPAFAPLKIGTNTLQLRVIADCYGVEVDSTEGLKPLATRTFDLSADWELVPDEAAP